MKIEASMAGRLAERGREIILIHSEICLLL